MFPFANPAVTVSVICSVSERLGIHVQVDQLLLDCPNGGRILSQILQLFVHKLVIVAAAEDGEAVVQLWGHPNEFPRVARDPETTDKGDTTKGLQGQG